MSLEQIHLNFVDGSSWACIREIVGFDEQSVNGTGILSAIRLLDRLLVNAPGTTVGPGYAVNLTSADRDCLLTAIYIRIYGSRVESTVNCENCKKPFDIDFLLEQLLDSLNSGKVSAIQIEKKQGGIFKLPNGCCFRLPTGEDECAVLGMTSEDAEIKLLKRCVLEGDPTGEKESLQDIMQVLAPLVDLNMDAHCPECNEHQLIHFDIQHFLLSSLKQEQRQLAYEVHRLAGAYGWSLNEILELPRSIRRTYVNLVESELGL